MQRILNALLGLVVAVLVVGVTLQPLTHPLFTRSLSTRYSLANQAGLPPARMLEVAEQVRAFVVDPAETTLPEQVDGRSGFDAEAVSHLADVRAVIGSAQVLTWLLLVALGVWVWAAFARGHLDRVAAALRAGAIWCVVLVALAAAAGMMDFDALFSAFHGLFFAEGTWTFASDSLLIQTFPETFWATAAGVWAALILAMAGALWLGAGALGRVNGGASVGQVDGQSVNGA